MNTKFILIVNVIAMAVSIGMAAMITLKLNEVNDGIYAQKSTEITTDVANDEANTNPKIDDTYPKTDNEWNRFLEAISFVETKGVNKVKHLDVNKKYSYGCLQIQKDYLTDSRLDYTLEDLYDKEISFKVARAYLERYGKAYEKNTGKIATYEVLARIHNGGPRGYKKSATVNYWHKVQNRLSILKAEQS